MKLTKYDIVEDICNSTELNDEDALDILDDFFDLMKVTLAKGEMIKINSFGNFEVQEKSTRLDRNPNTCERLEISARRIVVFKPSRVLRNHINESKPFK